MNCQSRHTLPAITSKLCRRLLSMPAIFQRRSEFVGACNGLICCRRNSRPPASNRFVVRVGDENGNASDVEWRLSCIGYPTCGRYFAKSRHSRVARTASKNMGSAACLVNSRRLISRNINDRPTAKPQGPAMGRRSLLASAQTLKCEGARSPRFLVRCRKQTESGPGTAGRASANSILVSLVNR
jgi:hypothetical protein